MIDVIYWNRFLEISEELNLTYTLYSSALRLENPKGVLLGEFHSVKDLYFYILGYQSGALDSKG